MVLPAPNPPDNATHIACAKARRYAGTIIGHRRKIRQVHACFGHGRRIKAVVPAPLRLAISSVPSWASDQLPCEKGSQARCGVRAHRQCPASALLAPARVPAVSCLGRYRRYSVRPRCLHPRAICGSRSRCVHHRGFPAMALSMRLPIRTPQLTRIAFDDAAPPSLQIEAEARGNKWPSSRSRTSVVRNSRQVEPFLCGSATAQPRSATGRARSRPARSVARTALRMASTYSPTCSGSCCCPGFEQFGIATDCGERVCGIPYDMLARKRAIDCVPDLPQAGSRAFRAVPVRPFLGKAVMSSTDEQCPLPSG